MPPARRRTPSATPGAFIAHLSPSSPQAHRCPRPGRTDRSLPTPRPKLRPQPPYSSKAIHSVLCQFFSWRCFPFVESAPQAYRLKASDAASPISTFSGTIPSSVGRGGKAGGLRATPLPHFAGDFKLRARNRTASASDALSVSRSSMKLACRMVSTGMAPISGARAPRSTSSLARFGEIRITAS
jgi:hypothetical protein